MNRLAYFILAFLTTVLIMLPAVAQSDQLNVQIVSFDDSFYPQIDVNFQVVDSATGRSVSLADNQVSATLNGQALVLGELQAQAASSMPIGIALVFDLTNSQSATFLDEQKDTASAIIDTLSPADQIAVITFDTNGAEIAVALGRDHNLALNTIDTLQIVNGPSNQFYDGVLSAMQVLRDGDPGIRKAAIIMTDVTDPQGSATPADSIAIAQQFQFPIYLIGFNDAQENVLTQFSGPSNGFTYMQRELEQDNVDLTRMASTISEVLKTEYQATFYSDTGATNTQQQLVLNINVSGIAGQTQQTVTARQRTLLIEFPNIVPGQLVSDEVTFDPIITYADNGETPEIQTAAYYLESGNITDVLNPPDSSDPIYTWNIEDVVGGLYTIRFDVSDMIGNSGSGRFTIEVESPIGISFVTPLDDPATSPEIAEVQPGEVPVEVSIEGSVLINDVKFFVDNELIDTLSEAPYIFTWNANNLAGEYVLRVEASDIQNNRTRAEQVVNVTIPEGIGYLAIGIAIAIAALVILLIVIIIMRRANDEQEEDVQQQNLAAPNVVPPPQGMPGNPVQNHPKLKVLRGVSDNGIQVYPLDRPELRVGRARNNDIRVIGGEASRDHGRILLQGGHYVYYDLAPNKPNRSKVNGMDLQGQHILREGDQIVIDQTEFLFTYQA